MKPKPILTQDTSNHIKIILSVPGATEEFLGLVDLTLHTVEEYGRDSYVGNEIGSRKFKELVIPLAKEMADRIKDGRSLYNLPPSLLMDLAKAKEDLLQINEEINKNNKELCLLKQKRFTTACKITTIICPTGKNGN